MKRYTSTIPLYYGRLHVMIAEDIDSAYRKWGDISTTPENYDACTEAGVSDRLLFISIFIKPTARHKDIAHECAHATNMIFEHVGAELSLSNDEPFCYLLSWVVDEVYKSLEKYNKG